jgi:hypothetical protein
MPASSRLSPELEQALKADSHRTKQNRRTAKALFVQIKAAATPAATAASPTSSVPGATGGQGAQGLRAVGVRVGEAFQFDWSDEGMVVGGIFYKLQVAHLKLCFSRAFWLVAYPSQGHEMLFDAHTRSFAGAGRHPAGASTTT